MLAQCYGGDTVMNIKAWSLHSVWWKRQAVHLEVAMSAMMGSVGYCMFPFEKHISLYEGGVTERFLEEEMSMMIPKGVSQSKHSMGWGAECVKRKGQHTYSLEIREKLARWRRIGEVLCKLECKMLDEVWREMGGKEWVKGRWKMVKD